MQNYQIASMFNGAPLQSPSQSMQYTPIKTKLEALHDCLYDSQNEVLDSGAKKRKFDQVTSEAEQIRQQVARFIEEPVDSLLQVRYRLRCALPGARESVISRAAGVEVVNETLGMMPVLLNKILIGDTFIHPSDLPSIPMALLEEGYVYKGRGRGARPATEKEKALYQEWKKRKKAFEEDKKRQVEQTYARVNSDVVTFRPVAVSLFSDRSNGLLSSDFVTISKLSDLW